MSVLPPEKTIAIVMAGGATPKEFGADVPAFKSLLPVRGKPLVEYTIAELETSSVEKIFVFHDDSNPLDDAITGFARTSFVPRPDSARSFTEGIRFALETLVDSEGLETVRNRLLLFLPCDLPLMKAAYIDHLITMSRSKVFDLAYTIVSYDLVKSRYPEKSFRKTFLTDLNAHFVLQTPSLLNGRFIHQAGDGTGISFGPWTRKQIDDLAQTIASIRSGRHGRLFALKFVYDMFFRRLGQTGQRRLLLEVVTRFLTRRLRSTDIDRLTLAIFQTTTVPIDSQVPEYSADIDHPEDMRLYFPA